MPRREVELVPGEHFHLYNRGHNREPIFFEAENYFYFLRQMKKYLVPTMDVVAYCLMPTHYHWLIRVNTPTVSAALMRFSVSFTKAMNKRYGRTGALFQGAFQAKRVGQDEYLLHLSRYIHLNPVRAGLVKRAEEWEFSSYQDYIGLREGKLPRPAIVMSQFSSLEAYRQFVESEVASERELIADLLFD